MEIMIMALLHKTDDSPWTDEELSPVKRYAIADVTSTWSALGVSLNLGNGKSFNVDFANIDGYRSC